MFDSAEIRVHPTGKAIIRLGTKSQGQGHETTYAQIVAEELGIPASNVQVEEGDTDTAPYGLGTYASRSTPTSGAAAAVAARKLREKARKIAAHLLECSPDDLVWEPGKFSVKGSPQKSKTIQDCVFAAYTNYPAGMEPGLEATYYYDPPNLTFPFGSYICVVDIDRGTGEVKVRRFVAIDDCGNIINPMIVEGQIHGGLTHGPGAGAVRGDQLRRERQQPGGQLHGLPPADRDGDAVVGDRSHHHALAAPSARRQGRGRVAHGGRAARHRQRGGGRALAPGRDARRHPDHAREGVEHPQGEGRGGVSFALDRRVVALAAFGIACWALSAWLMGTLHHAPGLWPLFAMWAPMMVAMMLPAEAPALVRLPQPLGYLAGYLAPWIAFSLGAAALQLRLQQLGVFDHHAGVLQSRGAAAALLVAAGALQWTPLKRACLDRCRSAPECGSLACGLRAGGLSVSSCGVLMLVPFATGVMNLWPMAAIAALLVLERAAPRRWPVSAAAGALLVAAGLWLAF